MRISFTLLLLYPIILLAQDPTSQQSNPPSSLEDLNAYLLDLAARNDTSIPFSLPGLYSIGLLRTTNSVLNITDGEFMITQLPYNLRYTCFQFDAVPGSSSHLYMRSNADSNAYYLELKNRSVLLTEDVPFIEKEFFIEYYIKFSSKTPFAWKLIQKYPGIFFLQADDPSLMDQVSKPVFLYFTSTVSPYFPMEPPSYNENVDITDFQFAIVPCSFTDTPGLDSFLFNLSVEPNKSVPLAVPGIYSMRQQTLQISRVADILFFDDLMFGCFQINPVPGDDTHVTIQGSSDPQALYLSLEIDERCSLNETLDQALDGDRECAKDYAIKFGSILPFYWKLHQDRAGNFYLEADDPKISAQEPRPFFLATIQLTDARPYAPRAPWVFPSYIAPPVEISQLQFTFDHCPSTR